MRYSLNHNSPHSSTAGFTLIEMLIIAPIVILALGGFIALMVTMVGNVLSTRDQTNMTYQSQDALNRVEDDIRLSAQFLTTTGALISPQGKNDSTTAFTNGARDTLILYTLATTKNPADSTRELVYYKNQPYDCGSQKIFNQVSFNKVIYYIKNNSLWRRTVVPTYNTNATVDSETVCAAPWQQNSCSPGYAGGTRCETNDIELMNDIGSLNVDYFAGANSTTEIGPANAQTATTVKVTVTGNKSTAGHSVTTTQSTRATRLNISVTPPTIVPLQFTTSPADQSVVYTDTNIQFSAKPSLNRATLQWQKSTDNGVTWANIAGATGTTYTLATVNTTMDGDKYRVIANSTNPTETATSDPARLTVRVWTPITLGSDWDAYETSQATYTTGMYTKTTAGLVMLKGLIAGGNTAFDSYIATLPTGYCPSDRLTFYVGSYDSSVSGSSGWGRVDVLPNCEIHFGTGTNTWISLDSIQFLASGTACAASVNLTPINGWSNYGGSYPDLSLCKDATGRINTKGLLNPGVLTQGTSIAAIPAGYQPTEHRLMPAIDARRIFNSVGIYGTPNYAIAARGSTTSYLSVNVPYIANNGAVTWVTPAILNGMVNFGGGFTTLQYGKTSDGVVMVKGLLKGGTVSNGTKVFTLPSGFHPSSRMLLPSASNNHHARIDVDTNGNVYLMGGGDVNYTSFDAVSFYADGN
jgi:Tfp pilus assembly protein PilV